MTFTDTDATEARTRAPIPLMIGLTGPSSSGKTFTALRLATGVQSVVGGDIFGIDTENRRMLHYAERFKFRHIDFQAPYGSDRYLEALRYAKSRGAGVVVVDSTSHEHDGPGGLLEQHGAELDRMAGNDYAKRDRVSMLAWQKPKTARRKLITAITTELAMPVIFCFRAKTGTKPAPKGSQDKQPVEMGFTSIGADEWLFEMGLNMLFMPGSNGHATWQSDKPGERLAIKCPGQFEWIKGDHQINEEDGARLARWSIGDLAGKPPAQVRAGLKQHAAAEAEARDADPDVLAYADELDFQIEEARDPKVLGTWFNAQVIGSERWTALKDAAPQRAAGIKATVTSKIAKLKELA